MGILSSAPDQSLSKQGVTFPSLPSEGREGDWKGVDEVAEVTSLQVGGGAVRTGRRRRPKRVGARACWSEIKSNLSSQEKCLILGWSELGALGNMF